MSDINDDFRPTRPVDIIFPNLRKFIDENVCFFCKRKIDPLTEWEDDLSIQEYQLSGLCQKCQNEIYK